MTTAPHFTTPFGQIDWDAYWTYFYLTRSVEKDVQREIAAGYIDVDRNGVRTFTDVGRGAMLKTQILLDIMLGLAAQGIQDAWSMDRFIHSDPQLSIAFHDVTADLLIEMSVHLKELGLIH